MSFIIHCNSKFMETGRGGLIFDDASIFFNTRKMPIFFSSNFFVQNFGDAEWVMLTKPLLNVLGCEEVCDFALFSFCSDGERKNFDWRKDAGKNWNVDDERVVVVSFILHHRLLRKAFKTTLVFSTDDKPVLVHLFFEAVRWHSRPGPARVVQKTNNATETTVKKRKREDVLV